MAKTSPEDHLDPVTRSLIHLQLNNLSALRVSHEQLLRLLEPDPFQKTDEGEVPTVVGVLVSPLRVFASELTKLIEAVHDDFSKRGIPDDAWNKLNALLGRANDCGSLGSALLPFRLGQIASEARYEIERLPEPGTPRQRKRSLLVASKELMRLIALYDLHRVLDRVEWTKEQLRSLVDPDNPGVKRQAVPQLQRIDEVVEEVVAEYRDSVNDREIDVRIAIKQPDVDVLLPKDELKKSLLNLVDNAIKYTGELFEDSQYDHTWIDLVVDAGNSDVYIAFESWGAPVTQEELDGRFMFKAGYRGWFARKNGIQGTGTGLADVLDFATRYGGDVLYETAPRGKQANPRTAVKTTVTIVVPRALT